MKLFLMVALCAMLFTPDTARACQSPEDTAQVATKAGATRLHLLEGEALDSFHKNYVAKFQREAPDDDRVEIWSLPSAKTWLLLSYSKGCVLGSAEVSPQFITELVTGEPL